MSYHPKPIDIEKVQLPEEILPLLERLAESTHDVWAQRRMADGWKWGPQRDDNQKLHPCLVPYDQLPESEKLYDRDVVEKTLKAILALGYRIVRG